MSEEQQNQQQGIVGEIVEGLHTLEQKVENFIHPAESDNAPSSAEPAPVSVAIENKDSLASALIATVAPAQEGGTAASGESTAAAQVAGAAIDPSAPSASAVTAPSTLSPAAVDAPAVAVVGEIGAAPAAPVPNAISATTSVDVAASGTTPGVGDAGNGTGGASDAPATSASNAAASGDVGTAAADDPNAGASTVVDASASDTQSSASPVSQVDVGLAIAASVSEAITPRVYQLRKHFWTFDEAARAPFIKLLDEIEALVK
ncbi:hypothetical protein [Burkholderia anthina]|uniref:hypothetical protein n=1 Tax=Burkholderia anthina TaxID=179879 RepID=UPI001589BA1B|nr:hypothetical protein [Burkholderia anthina]